jgi:hypothetical protein
MESMGNPTKENFVKECHQSAKNKINKFSKYLLIIKFKIGYMLNGL